MAILVSDTSVLIELERGGLLEPAFSCGLIMVVPDLLYQKEIEEENGPYLRALGLGVVALTPDEVELAQTIKMQRPALSLPDCFALTCAHRQAHILVTGDMKLRKEAENRNVQVCGLLWILDQMEACGNFSYTLLHEGLSQISADPRCRLPKDEVNIRLTKWAKQIV
jgi:predicted nucleic acid-binding protein